MEKILLYPGGSHDARGTEPHDQPWIDVYEPFGFEFQGNGILILPGGGYGMLSAQEGEGFAGWFRLLGYHCFVLNYRLGSQGYRHPSMWNDATRAMRILRSRSEEWGIPTNRFGVIGSSAGGHLAATLLTKWDRGDASSKDIIEQQSSRPDYGILCYPVISMKRQPHSGSRANLIGEDATPELDDLLSAEQHVAPDTAPCFIWHTVADPVVPVENSLNFASALRAERVSFELHCYETGDHGLGMKDGHPWTIPLLPWLRNRLR
ncbi:MAG: alpha/beta hydrolase [Chthoniobacterales bacterium]